MQKRHSAACIARTPPALGRPTDTKTRGKCSATRMRQSRKAATARHAPLGATVRKAAVSGTRSQSKRGRWPAHHAAGAHRAVRRRTATRPGEAACATTMALARHTRHRAPGPADPVDTPGGCTGNRSNAGPPRPRRLIHDGRSSNLTFAEKEKTQKTGRRHDDRTAARLEEQLRRRPDDAAPNSK